MNDCEAFCQLLLDQPRNSVVELFIRHYEFLTLIRILGFHVINRDPFEIAYAFAITPKDAAVDVLDNILVLCPTGVHCE
jgi:hypothetical protein